MAIVERLFGQGQVFVLLPLSECMDCPMGSKKVAEWTKDNHELRVTEVVKVR